MGWTELAKITELLPLCALKFGAEGSTTTSTTYVTIADSDIALDPWLFSVAGLLYLRFLAHIKNNTSGETTYIRIYRQNAGTPISGTELTQAGPDWGIKDSGWIAFSDQGLESYQIQLKVTGGTGEFNSAVMILSYKQL